MKQALFLLLLPLLVACGRPAQGKFGPDRGAPQAGLPLSGQAASGQAAEVSFAELEAGPEQFLNQLLRVSGQYAALAGPACRPGRGPQVRWALIDGSLRLDAVGYENILRLVPPGLSLVVEGVWRRYQGPLGCGKKPPAGTAWYLQTVRIVSPNPLPQRGLLAEQAGAEGATGSQGGNLLGPPPLLPTATPAAEGGQGEDAGISATPAISATVPAATPTAGPVVASATPSPTATPAALPTSAGSEQKTPTAVPPATPTPSATPSPASTPVSTAVSTATAAGPTATPVTFPTATPGPPVPTFTPGPYPYP